MTCFITFTLKIIRIPNKYLLHTILSINFFAFTSTFIFMPTLFILETFSPNLHSHLHVPCHSINLVSLVLDIRSNTLTFKLFYNIRNTNFCIRIVNIITSTTTFTRFNTNGKNTGSFLLTLTTCGFVLHSRLFIEIQLNELALAEPDKKANPMENTFLTNPNIFIYTISFFFHQILMNIFNIINIAWMISNTYNTNITIKSSIFHIII